MVLSAIASLLSRPHAPPPDSALGAVLGVGVMLVLLVIALAIWLVFGFILSKVFAKANKPTIAAYIPIWNMLVVLEMVGKPAWWVILYFIPFVNILVHIYVQALLLERFGMEPPMTFVLPIIGAFFPIIPLAVLIWLAFGDEKYRAPPGYRSPTPAY